MTVLQAVSAGTPLPPPSFRGVVHSVFSSGVNIKVEGLGTLVSLHSFKNRDLPGGFRISEGAVFPAGLMYPGMRVVCESQLLRFPGAQIQADLGGAETFDCRFGGGLIDAAVPRVSRAIRFAEDSLRQKKAAAPQPAAFDAALRSRIDGALSSLVGAGRGRDAEGMKAAASSLLGLGLGLTPAGDDILLGFMAGLLCAGGGGTPRSALIGEFAAALEALSARTNDISRSYLVHAAAGYFGSPLLALARVVAEGEGREAVTEAAAAVMSAGHTSGTDTLTGFLAALSL